MRPNLKPEVTPKYAGHTKTDQAAGQFGRKKRKCKIGNSEMGNRVPKRRIKNIRHGLNRKVYSGYIFAR